MKYYIGKRNKEMNLELYKEINKYDFDNFMKFYTKFKRYQELDTTYKIAKQSYIDFREFIIQSTKSLNLGVDLELGYIHFKGIDFILKFILLSRLYIENLKEYLRNAYGEKSSEYLKFKEKEIEIESRNFNYTFLRLLRNYAQHHSLPISTTSKIYNCLKEEYEPFKFYMYREKLLEKKFKEEKEIQKNIEEKIILNHYIDIWFEIIEEISNLVLSIFSHSIESEFKLYYSKYEDIINYYGASVVKYNKDYTYDLFIIDDNLYKKIQNIVYKVK